jgi:hypothetical protein
LSRSTQESGLSNKKRKKKRKEKKRKRPIIKARKKK